MRETQLYLLVGYPGAGKTTVARLIAERTRAVHLWTDQERLKMFEQPTHSTDENERLYTRLNEKTGQLLGAGKSVIFDTNFNLLKDRQHLKSIAEQHGAETIIIWLTTPKEIAKARSVDEANLRNGYTSMMSEAQFDTIATHLEPPTEDEKIIKIDGTKLDEAELMRLLNL